ncbi:MAG: recombinase family protein, partial [Planctomycetota bacterium]
MRKDNLQNDNLSFAIFPRVSTEKQAERGSSLEVQVTAMQQYINNIKGKIVANYGGQEHATPAFEHDKLEELIKDSFLPFEERKWNAVMFYDPSRFSRDNSKAEPYLDKLQMNKIRFFTIGQEWNLFDPDQRCMLSIHTSFGRLQATKGTKKSLEVRIAKAEQGYFASGPPPFGRERDKVTGKLRIIKKKKKDIETAARLYLDEGLGFIKIAKILGMNASVLQRALIKNSGDTYIQHFKCEGLGIDEEIPTKIPPLLDKVTIKRIQDEAAKRRKYHPGVVKSNRLLCSYIFCDQCGKRLSVQEAPSKN